MSLSRFLAPAVLAAGLGAAALAAPVPAQAQSSDMMRVLVQVADVVMRGNQPYYRHGDYGYNDRLIVQRDRYGNPVYYRQVPRQVSGPPYGNAYGYHRNRGNPVTGQQQVRCDRNGRCTTQFYDPRYDRNNRYGSNVRYDQYGRWWDGYRWRDR